MPHKRSLRAISRRYNRGLLLPPTVKTRFVKLFDNVLPSIHPQFSVNSAPYLSRSVHRQIFSAFTHPLSLVLEDWRRREIELKALNRYYLRVQRRIQLKRQKNRLLFAGLPRLKYFDLGVFKVKVSKNHFISYMPGNKKKNRSKRSGGKGKEVSSGLRGVQTGDLMLAPRQPTNVPKSVPKGFARQIIWTTHKLDSTVALSVVGITETAFAYNFGTNPQVGSWLALYDAYTITQMAVTVYSLEPPGSLVSPPLVHSAIDFDSIAALGSVAAISTYESHVVDALPPGKAITRMCRPCVQTQLVGGLPAISRLWLPVAANNIAWNGVRFIFETQIGAAASSVHVTVTAWIALRSGV